MTAPRRALIGLLLVITVGACGGGDDEARPAVTTITTDASTATTPPTFTGAGSEQFCGQAEQAEDQLTKLAQASPSPEATREVFVSVADALQALSDDAPAEIKPDVAVIAGAYRDLVGELESMGWQGPQMVSTIANRLSQPDVKAASERLRAYQESVCGKGPPTTGAPA